MPALQATYAFTEMSPNRTINCLLDYEDPYVQPLIVAAFQKRLPAGSYRLIQSAEEHRSGPLVQFGAYEALDFDKALEQPGVLINAYVIRKALIRKHYLSTTVFNWCVKHPDSKLKSHVKPSVEFELDYAEFLDEALVEAFELQESFQKNEGKEPQDREWWILKPGMSDRGQGIKLFSTEEELQSIFEAWEAERPDSDDDEEDENSSAAAAAAAANADARSDADGETTPPTTPGGFTDFSAIQVTHEKKEFIITSHLRHFVAQPYIDPPLLFDGRKFHIRTYVLAAAALRVYVYHPMLALFAAAPYTPPWTNHDDPDGEPDLRAHLTNTCLQGTDTREGSVRSFWSLPDAPGLPHTWKDDVFTQICGITAETFEAAARGMMIHFQPLPQAFELYGVDFMVDAAGKAWLLEVNAYPDFRQTGEELRGVVEGLMEETVEVAVKPFFGVEGASGEGTEEMRKVLDVDLGRR